MHWIKRTAMNLAGVTIPLALAAAALSVGGQAVPVNPR